jgi:hypothetical protein
MPKKSTMLAGFRGLLHKVLSTPPFVLVWEPSNKRGGQERILDSANYQAATVGDESKKSRWLWRLE